VTRSAKLARPEGKTKPRISATSWVLIATLAGTAMLVYTGLTTGEWRGVVISEVQIVVVGLATWLVLRAD